MSGMDDKKKTILAISEGHVQKKKKNILQDKTHHQPLQSLQVTGSYYSFLRSINAAA